MPWLAWAAVALTFLALLAALLVWLLVVTEGAYLGPRVVTALYDSFAGRYDRIKQFDDGDEAYFLGEPVERYLRSVEAAPASSPWLLDVAAGTGRFILAVSRAGAGHCRCVALDRSHEMLRHAQRKLAGPERTSPLWLQHDAAPLPFGDCQFDVVACLEALEFMPDPRAVIRELMRVARPGGLVLVTRRIGWDARLMPGKVFERAELADLLRAAGAGAVEIRPWQVDYDLAWALKAAPAAGQAPAAEWPDFVRCPHHGSAPVVARRQGASDELACAECDWRLRLVDGIWRRT